MGDIRNDQPTGVGERYAGYQIYDRHYHKVGKVDDLFVDEDDRLEYIGMKTGFLSRGSVLIPMEIVRVSSHRRLLQIEAEKDTIMEGPSFDEHEEITPEIEARVHAYFGTGRESSYIESSTDRGGYGPYYGDDITTGTGEGSSVDVLHDERTDARKSGAPGEPLASGELRGRDEEIDATDAARRKARELGIDLTQVKGTGSGGRVVIWDVKEPVEYPPSPTGPEPDHAGENAGEVGPGMRMGDTESGEFRGHDPDNEGVRQRGGSDLEDEDELRVQRSEEELRAGTREREAGSVNVRKRVRTDRERISVPTRHEEVSVERVPVEGRRASEAEIGEEEVSMPVAEEEVVVEKRPVKKEEIRVRKEAVADETVVEEDVRKEEVEVEDATERGSE